MQGATQGTPLVGSELRHGASMAELLTSISDGYPLAGMPAWSKTYDVQVIKSLALWISEHRDDLLYSEFNISSALDIPSTTQSSEHYNFDIDVVADNLDPLPYSIALRADGSILLTEKMAGLRIVAPDGTVSALIEGTPKVYADTRASSSGLEFGLGWLLDVALHPNYAENGWVYIHYTDRCDDCNQISRETKRPVSMNALIRGRIKDGRWVDEQVVYKSDLAHYTSATDVAAGGRIAFDPEGFVFMSIGMKSMEGIQDLRSPHGKTLRMHDDGRIPTDNPYVDHPHADKRIWSYGHRSPQGLEFHVPTRTLWGTEHGPRGGDEVNILLPGRNYGWPLFSAGQNYSGTEVAWGREHSETELKDIEQPVVDMTPSPAISSFVFYAGDAFPAWSGDLLVGSLKATDLYRMTIADNKLIHMETVVENLARIRDIEIDAAGIPYLLLEHASGGQIVRLLPAVTKVTSTQSDNTLAGNR
jgi:glucose/arabinose dehydrogenase